MCFIFYIVSSGSSRVLSIQWSMRDVWYYFLLIELSWTQICEFKTHLEVRVSIFEYLLSPPKLIFVFIRFSWTSKARFDTALKFWIWVSELKWEKFWIVGSEERWEKVSKWERVTWRLGWYWLGKTKGQFEHKRWNGLKVHKNNNTFHIKYDSHISHCWVLKMLLCWDGKPKAQLSFFFIFYFI